MGLVQAVLLPAGTIELFRVGPVRDVPRVQSACPAVQAVRASDPHHPADAGTAATDQGAAKEVRQGPPAHGARDAEAAAGARLQSDPGLSPDARPDPRVPGSLPRVAFVQP